MRFEKDSGLEAEAFLTSNLKPQTSNLRARREEMSSAVIHLITYAAVLAFGAVVAWRAFRIYSMPMHLRWELYPVAHE